MKLFLVAMSLFMFSCAGSLQEVYKSETCFDYDSCKQACELLNDKRACNRYLNYYYNRKTKNYKEPPLTIRYPYGNRAHF